MNRELKAREFESILTVQGALDASALTKSDIVSYAMSLQEHVVELNSKLSTQKKDADVIACVNIGAQNSLGAIKAQLECQVEELAAQLVYKDKSITSFKRICSEAASALEKGQDK